MDANSILNLARTQLATLIELTNDDDAAVRLKLAISALGNPQATAQGQPTPLAAADPVQTAPVAFPAPAAYQPQDAVDDEPGGAYDDYADEDDEPVIPEGFATRAEYDNFLLSQAEAVADDPNRTVDEYAEGVMGVVGVDDAGNALGDADDLVTRANAFAAQLEAEAQADEDDFDGDDEQADVTEFRVRYVRQDGQPLTEAQVHAILDSQASQPLRLMGTMQGVRVENGDGPAQKVAVFQFGDDGLNLEAVARGFVAYRGVKVFPGIGRVLAVGQAA
jgi:hypothetical protein